MKIVSALKWIVKGDAIASQYKKKDYVCKYGPKSLWEIYNGVKSETDEVKLIQNIIEKNSLYQYFTYKKVHLN